MAGDVFLGIAQHVKNHARNHVSRDGINFEPVVIAARMSLFKICDDPVNKRQFAQFFNREKSGIETVVDVMIVVGNVIGNRTDLSFQRRIIFQVKIIFFVEFF